MCSTVYLARMEPTPQAAGLLPRCLFHFPPLARSPLSLLAEPHSSPSLSISFSSFVPLHSHFLSLIRFLRLVLSSSFTFFVPSHSPLRASFICLLHYHSTFLISVQPHPPGASSALLLNTWKPSEAARLIPSLVSLPSVLLLFPFLILSASLLNMRKTIYFPSPLSHSNLHLFKFHCFASFPDLFVAIVPLLRII